MELSLRALAWLSSCFSLAAMLCGCQTARFYKQALQGQLEILSRREPITKLLADPQTPPQLKGQFQLVLELRHFATTNLGLPINKHYLSYVDLGRRFAVWNVHAAPEFSLEPKSWWYPLVGRLKYRGYFSEEEARSYTAKLQEDAWDVHVEGVEAYSTLGWFADPVLNTFIQRGEVDLAEILFHELAHQRLFVAGDTDFNEAFATAVAEEGVRRWLRSKAGRDTYEAYLRALQRNLEFVRLIKDARHRLEMLYARSGRSRSGAGASSGEAAELRQEKARLIAHLREDYVKLKASWGGYSGYDRWFEGPLNNAQLNTVAIYYELVPGFQALLGKRGNDLGEFYHQVRRLSRLRKDDRHRRLHELAGER